MTPSTVEQSNGGRYQRPYTDLLSYNGSFKLPMQSVSDNPTRRYAVAQGIVGSVGGPQGSSSKGTRPSFAQPGSSKGTKLFPAGEGPDKTKASAKGRSNDFQLEGEIVGMGGWCDDDFQKGAVAEAIEKKTIADRDCVGTGGCYDGYGRKRSS